MRTRATVLVGVVAALGVSAAVGADPAVEFKPFATAAGRYKVLFPGAVRSETTDVKTPAGDRKLTFDSVQVGEGLVFMVTYLDVPDDVAKQPPGPRLDKVRDGNKGPAGKVLADAEVAVGADKLPGRDILVEKAGTHVRNRIVLSGNRLYQVMVQGPKEFVTSKDADRFVESFEVTK